MKKNNESTDQKLKVGDRVMATRDVDGHPTDGCKGTLKRYDREGIHSVEFDKFIDGHSCDGLATKGFGLWVDEQYLEKLEEDGQAENRCETQEDDQVTASKQGILECYEDGCSEIREYLAKIFPETIKEHKEGCARRNEEVKRWYLSAEPNAVYARDSDSDTIICCLIHLSPLFREKGVKEELENNGYNPYWYGHDFDEYGSIVVV